MLQSILDSSAIPLLEKLAVFGERRQEVLAGNIANVNTPDYKARDLPVAKFQEALRQAVADRHSSPVLSLHQSFMPTQTRSIEEYFPSELFAAVEGPQRDVTFQDGNNRSIENANMEMLKNTMLQNFAVEMMHAQFNQLQAVISERP